MSRAESVVDVDVAELGQALAELFDLKILNWNNY